MSRFLVSYEFVRECLNDIDKFEKKAALLGKLFAAQQVREIGRLHTHYSNHRGEYDYTKFGAFLFPNPSWNEPVLFHDGIGIDQHSTVIRGAVLTQAPAARDTIRLVKNCVLPKSLTLPRHLQHLAQSWDVYGLERIAAIDNGMELIANGAVLVFVACGIIVLRMPPFRGDSKGTVERTNDTMEMQFTQTIDGYIPRQEKGMNPRYNRMRETAKRKANLTVDDYLTRRAEYILEFNDSKHPRLPISRIQVYRNGLIQAPPILPTGVLQIKALFALTYEVTLLREGVTVENLKYNSTELHEIFKIYTGKVFVKLNVDDIREVLVIVPQFDEPIVAKCTTFEFNNPMPQEMWGVLLKRIESKYPGAIEREEISFVLPDVYGELQNMVSPSTPGTTPKRDAQAATQAALQPAIPAKQQQLPDSDADLSSLLGGTEINGG